MCGEGRIAGNIYLECGVAPGGSPVESFLIDPPQPVDRVAWGINPLGVMTLVEDGVTHLLDWVGEHHYPEVADFIEEVRRKGVSRLVARSVPFANLTPESCLFLLHPRASVSNAPLLSPPPDFHCPTHQGHSAWDDCLGLAWHAPANLPGGQRKLYDQERYSVKSALTPAPEYQLAHFMTVPITCISVINTPDQQHLEAQVELASQSGLPVIVADE